jgi:hypothetical protein
MRLRILALLFVVGCSPSERVGARIGGEEPARTDGNVHASPDAAGSDSPRATEPTQSSDEALPPFLPFLSDPLGASCPIPASTCPDRCASVAGWRFEEANPCYSRVVVACLPAVDGTYSMNSDLGCYKRDDGVILATSPSTVGHKLGPGWSGCDLHEDLPDAPPCP